jgi:undecaprenyl-diphosphatase
MRHRSNAAHLLWSRLQSGELAPLLTFLGVTGLVLVFGLLANQTRGGGALSFDAAVQAALQSPTGHGPIGPPWLEEAVRDVTALGSFAFLGLLLVAVVGYLLLVRKRGMALLMLVAVLGGTVMSSLLKVGFDRPRPEITGSVRVFTASFPSGHATLSAATFLTIGVLLARLTREPKERAYFLVLAVLLTVLVGLSRLYLGVHYASDVLAGWCAGSAWAILCWSVALLLQRRRQIEAP